MFYIHILYTSVYKCVKVRLFKPSKRIKKNSKSEMHVNELTSQ